MAPTSREPLTGEIAATLQDRHPLPDDACCCQAIPCETPSHGLLTDGSPTLRIVAQVYGSLLGKLKGPPRLSRKCHLAYHDLLRHPMWNLSIRLNYAGECLHDLICNPLSSALIKMAVAPSFSPIIRRPTGLIQTIVECYLLGGVWPPAVCSPHYETPIEPTREMSNASPSRMARWIVWGRPSRPHTGLGGTSPFPSSPLTQMHTSLRAMGPSPRAGAAYRGSARGTCSRNFGE